MSNHSNGNEKESDYAEGHKETLSRFRSAQSISMTPELFEKLYLSPQNKVKGDLRKTFANPTPMYVARQERLRNKMYLSMLTVGLKCRRRVYPLSDAAGVRPHGLARCGRQWRSEHVSGAMLVFFFRY